MTTTFENVTSYAIAHLDCITGLKTHDEVFSRITSLKRGHTLILKFFGPALIELLFMIDSRYFIALSLDDAFLIDLSLLPPYNTIINDQIAKRLILHLEDEVKS